jgi:P27 family predicted phage terminase small subunit
MPNRRDLKIKTPLEAVRDDADPRIGGIGLNFGTVPAVLDVLAAGEWDRLSHVYRQSPTRFREGDRAALTAYCVYYSAFHRAAAEVAERGPVVEGRSAKDRDRAVKNPATVAMREASMQLRYWARELGLTPDARGRSGIREYEPDRFGDNDLLTNPFRAPDPSRLLS